MKINELIKQSMKAQDTIALGAYRMVKAKIEEQLNKKNNKKTGDDLFVSMVKLEMKEREETNSFIKGESETKETNNKIIEILKIHLPKMLSKGEQINLIKETVESGASNMGKLMGILSNRDDIDMKAASAQAKEIFQGR